MLNKNKKADDYFRAAETKTMNEMGGIEHGKAMCNNGRVL